MRVSPPVEFVFPDRFGETGHRWMDQLFSAKAVRNGGIVRRKLTDVDREIGRAFLLEEVNRRGYHAVICGGQFIIICNPGRLQVLT